jgi:hypothetical protein
MVVAVVAAVDRARDEWIVDEKKVWNRHCQTADDLRPSCVSHFLSATGKLSYDVQCCMLLSSCISPFLYCFSFSVFATWTMVHPSLSLVCFLFGLVSFLKFV